MARCVKCSARFHSVNQWQKYCRNHSYLEAAAATRRAQRKFESANIGKRRAAAAKCAQKRRAEIRSDPRRYAAYLESERKRRRARRLQMRNARQQREERRLLMLLERNRKLAFSSSGRLFSGMGMTVRTTEEILYPLFTVSIGGRHLLDRSLAGSQRNDAYQDWSLRQVAQA